jgi:hypothetical protein
MIAQKIRDVKRRRKKNQRRENINSIFTFAAAQCDILNNGMICDNLREAAA